RKRWSRPRCAPTTTAAPSASRARSTRPVRCSRARCPPPSPAGSRARSSAASNDDTHHKLGGVDALAAVALGQDVEPAALVRAERGDLVALTTEPALAGDPAALLHEATDRAGAVVAVHVYALERGNLRAPVHIAADGSACPTRERV